MISSRLPEQSDDAAQQAIHDDDEAAFAARAERYRRQLRFAGRSLFRTLLYRIATNTCLGVLDPTLKRGGHPPREGLPP